MINLTPPTWLETHPAVALFLAILFGFIAGALVMLFILSLMWSAKDQDEQMRQALRERQASLIYHGSETTTPNRK